MDWSGNCDCSVTFGDVESVGVEVVMDGRDREKDSDSTEEREAAKYESMTVDELDDRLRRAGIDPTRTIVAIQKLVHSKLKEWPK